MPCPAGSSSEIACRLEAILRQLPADVRLVTVSKFKPVEAIMEAYEAGQRRFGESRVQEFLMKREQLPADIEWHFIGHLQSNKVRSIIGKTALIESVDTEKLLSVVDSESARAGCVTKVLMQVHVAREETKFGFFPDEIRNFFAERKFESLVSTHISGLMAMASNTDDTERIRRDFATVASLMEEVRSMCPDLRGFDSLSMGMSGDWPIAVREGANIIRVGSSIFGDR